MTRMVLIGEPLVELTQPIHKPGVFRQGLGGDTLNTAVYLARMLGPGQIRYVTRLGNDRLSDWILSKIADEGIDTASIMRMPGKTPGLSMIECAPDGERSFTYWREQSAARKLLQENAAEDTSLAEAPALFVSAVTLAIISPGARARLVRHMMRLKASGRPVYFDLNYRPTLWENAELARSSVADALAASTLALPSLDDVSELWGADTPVQALETLRSLGAQAVLLKTGGGPVYYSGPEGQRSFPLERVARPVDTTGAGDSFNAAFLASRLNGADIAGAVASGHALAARVVLAQGAILPPEAMPDTVLEDAG